LVLTIGGCKPADVETQDVIQLDLCQDSDSGSTSKPCSKTADALSIPADGRSTAVLKVCASSSDVSSSDRRTDLSATLHATRGSWIGHAADEPATLLLPFGSSRCQLATLVADQSVGDNRIDATLLGYTTFQTLTQVPTTVEYVDFTSETLPPLQGTDPATVQLTVAAHSDTGGLPSAGTRVEFSAGGAVTMSPVAAILDADGHAAVNVFVPSDVNGFTISANVITSAPKNNTKTGSIEVKRQ